MDNVIGFWEDIKWAHLSNPHSLFIKLDFKKAYDRIEWTLIISMLEALVFGS